jgi:hypothetical protein
MEEKRNVYRLLVGKPEGKRPLGRPRCGWLDNIKMDLLEIAVNVVNSVMNHRVPQNAGNYQVAAQVVASRAVLSSTELVS